MDNQRRIVNPVLNMLVCSVEAVLASELNTRISAGRIAAELRPFLGRPDLLEPEQRESDPQRYRQHILYIDEQGRFSLVALVWLVGQSTAVHDHVSWCVMGVLQGQEHEVQYQVIQEGEDRYLLPVGEHSFAAGAVSVLHPPGDIHTVSNPGPGTAISLHIYGADVRKIGSSVRFRYDLPIMSSVPLPCPPYIGAREA